MTRVPDELRELGSHDLFPSFDSAERVAFEESLAPDTDALVHEAAGLAALDEATLDAWEAIVLGYERVSARLSHLAAYVGALASVDAGDERYALAEARLNWHRAAIEKLAAELRCALGAASDPAFGGFCARPALTSASFALSRFRIEAKTRMAPVAEGLAADLGTDGIMAWGRLYDTLSGKLTFEMELPDGSRKVLPVSQCRSLTADPDRRVREAAFRGSNRAWADVADTAAAALNHIAGVRHTLNARRGVAHFLDVALHQAAITRKTLDAMLEALSDRIEIPRRGLRLKTRAMRLPAAAWFDMEAPFPVPEARRVSYEEGVGMISAAFSRRYPKLANHFEGICADRWIDANPSPHKRPGAYCAFWALTYETRVFMSFQGSMLDVSTLAHEVGHAFHATWLENRRFFETEVPMTLAETASTFAELLLADGLSRGPALALNERILLLGKVVSDGVAFLLNLPTRFFFEKRFCEERLSSEVPPSRLSEPSVCV